MNQPLTKLPDYLDIILARFTSDPVIGPALVGSGDNPGRFFGWVYGEDDIYGRLSGGERVLMDLALALWNGNRDFRIADLGQLDDANRHRACTAIIARFCPLWGQE